MNCNILALSSGTVSQLSGGSFRRGFMMGAYQYGFNHLSGEIEGRFRAMFSRQAKNIEAIKHRKSLNAGTPSTESLAIKSGYRKVSVFESILHKIGGPSAWRNRKYLGPGGFKEAVYNNGRPVEGINAGSYNVVPNSISNGDHIIYDMVPFFLGY